MKQPIKITKERQQGLLPLVATDEITKTGKVSKRLVRQDTKELAIMFCQMNKVGQDSGMKITHASDLLGVPYTLLKEWLAEHETLIVENDSQYLARLAHREKVLLDSLFNPLDLAMQELNNRLQNYPDVFSNADLMKVISLMANEYTKVYTMRLQRETITDNVQSEQDDNFSKFKDILSNAQNRLVIDQDNPK